MRVSLTKLLGGLCVCAHLAGCQPAPADDAAIRGNAVPPPQPSVYGAWGDPFAELPAGPAQLQRVCARAGDDIVRDRFCGEQPAEITSLDELEVALELGPTAPPGVSGAALTGHSTALSARSVSAINPRVILFRLDVATAQVTGSPEMVALSFNRGDQFVEMVTFDRRQHEYSFYLLRFEQACNAAAQGCMPGDLLTDAIERDWQNLTLYDETALANTQLDCAPCHQPDGPNSPKLLRMQEFESPWTHWFFKSNEGGRALIEDYSAAKGDESVAGLLRDQVESSPPGGLSLFVGSRNHEQPNVFDSAAIEREVKDSAARDGGKQPFDNRIAGSSATWRKAYERAQRGESITVPYHDVKVTDPDKLERLTEAYQAYRAGALARQALPDLRDVFPDDPARLAAMGLLTEPGLSGEAVLISACSMCHNPHLDQSLSRARFRADLAGLSRAEKDLAIERLSLPADDIRAMPPARLRMLSSEARARAIEALRR